MPVELFVWYRATPEWSHRVVTAARQVLARAARDHGVTGRLLQRADAEYTWMEHYPLDRADDALVLEFARGLGAWEAGLPPRHAERFARVDDGTEAST